MIEALVGTLIALVATGALALMAEIFTFAPSQSTKILTPHEKMLIDRVYIEKHGIGGGSAVTEWLQRQEIDHPRAKLDALSDP